MNRNLIRDNRIVPGGGASEVAAAIAIENFADVAVSSHQDAIQAFSTALLTIPEALADNSGLNVIAAVTEAKARQIKENNPMIGIDCMGEGTADMIEQNIWESLSSKESQVALATQASHKIGLNDFYMFHN